MNNNLQKGGGVFTGSYCDRFNNEACGTSGGNLTGEQEQKFDTMAQQLEMLLKIATTNSEKREDMRKEMKVGYDEFKKNDNQARADINNADDAEEPTAHELAEAKKQRRFKFVNIRKGLLSRPRNDAIKNAKTVARNRAIDLRNTAKEKFKKGREALSEAIMSNPPPSATAVKRPSFGRRAFSTPNLRQANMENMKTERVGGGGTIKKKNKGQKITRKKINKKYKKSGNTKRQKSKKI